MQQNNKETVFDRYPILAFVFPIVGGFFAWQVSGSIELGAFLLLAGTLSNGFFVYKRRKQRE